MAGEKVEVGVQIDPDPDEDCVTGSGCRYVRARHSCRFGLQSGKMQLDGPHRYRLETYQVRMQSHCDVK
eukprot:5655976-Amphidinium_carterae.1